MIIKNGLVFLNGEFVKKDIRILEGVISEISTPGTLTEAIGEEVTEAGAEYVLPGLVDIHSHGRVGEDFSIVTLEGLERLCKAYVKCGVTAVLATTMTNPPKEVEASLEAIREYRKWQEALWEQKKQAIKAYQQIGQATEARQRAGQATEVHHQKKGTGSGCGRARLLGVHMEGPFLGKEKKGAHDERYLTAPDKAWFDTVQGLSGNGVKLMTIDPTLSGAEEFIRYCREKHITVSLGHTSCNYELAKEACSWGADHITHGFNAMNGLHHREPGLIGAALDFHMYTELICDGIHLHPAIIRMMFAAHPEQMILISDSMPAAGLPDGNYRLGGLPVRVTNGKAVQPDGTIAGSTISVFEAMRNAVRFGVPKEQAVLSASYLPAKSVGLEEIVGSIAVGRSADILLVNKDWELEQVLIAGEQV